MPYVCQSRPSEVYPKQSTKNGKTLSKMMASGFVDSYCILVLRFINNVRLLVTDTPLLQIYKAFCSNLTVSFAACTARSA